MLLYKKYIEEREDAFLEYNDKGFMSYKIDPMGLYIIDAFVEKDSRKEGIIKELLSVIIEKTNINKVYTTTDVNANNWKTSEKVILALGFKKTTQINTLNYYIKEICSG